jgi:hypothetical protein
MKLVIDASTLVAEGLRQRGRRRLFQVAIERMLQKSKRS